MTNRRSRVTEDYWKARAVADDLVIKSRFHDLAVVREDDLVRSARGLALPEREMRYPRRRSDVQAFKPFGVENKRVNK